MISRLKKLFIRKPLVIREYDIPVARDTKKQILGVCHKFKIRKKKIDGLIRKLEKIGPGGVKVEEFKEQITDPKIKRCYYDLLQTLHDKWAGIALILYPDARDTRALVGLERRGRYYFDIYLNK